jgi:hypothetical protein
MAAIAYKNYTRSCHAQQAHAPPPMASNVAFRPHTQMAQAQHAWGPASPGKSILCVVRIIFLKKYLCSFQNLLNEGSVFKDF